MDNINKLKCSIEGCSNIRMSKGTNARGKKRYRNICSTHHKQKSGLIWGLGTKKCSICNWSGPCDKHRIKFGKDGGKYTLGNVAVLCPNCHRLLHLGKLKLG